MDSRSAAPGDDSRLQADLRSESTRIIAAPDAHDHWSAWLEDRPGESWGGETAATAVMRLLRANGIGVELVEPDYDPARPDRQVFRLRRGEVCQDCGGSGRYVGLNVVEMCGACGGSGSL